MTFWQRFKPIRARLLVLLAVVGPGIITANADNDAGGITTYSVAGAHYGYELLWIMPLVALALIVVQEMSARLGVVTGKGLAGLIRENMGVRAAAIILSILMLANLANTISEFAGVAASMEVFGVSKYISVPLAALAVWLLIVKGSYKSVERVFLVASLVYLSYIASCVLARPNWPEVAQATLTPKIHLETGYLMLAITIIGTTIAPWMQFYQQSAIADKGLKVSDYAYERLDVIVGSIYGVVIAAFIVIACAATLFVSGQPVETAKDAAMGLIPLAGSYASALFALGLLNASLFTAAILPLSTAYVFCEAFGWESGVDHGFSDAPVFFGLYTAFIVFGAGVILLPIQSLVQVMMISQTFNGILLPFILVVMLLLVNNRRVMGRFVNGRFLNIISWVIVIALIVLTVILVVSSVFPGIAGPGAVVDGTHMHGLRF
jgi:NRAMP (natural resistance-associated macrophage protein)-like metal ion transporter